MHFSTHNIFGQIKNSKDYFLVNLLSGEADILDADEGKRLESGDLSQSPWYDAFVEKGYVVDPEQERVRYRQRYLEFIDARDQDEVQIFFSPGYACNFGCSYCYQEEYTDPTSEPDEALLDAFFAYVDSQFADRKKYLTLFGGEPLLPSPARRKMVESFLHKATERNLGVAVVTNGHTLTRYLPLLKKAVIREVQVTLDGPRQIHDMRRPLKGGQPTFDKIVEGVDACLSAELPVNLRVVVDRDNLQSLPELAQFAKDRGWTDNPLFKTQLGRNYELHTCQTNQNRLYTRISLYEELYSLIQEHPVVMDFHRPAFSVARFLFDEGRLPDPLFDSCPGAKNEWAFDAGGRIFSCTATIGKQGEELGMFWPEIKHNEDAIGAWEDRDVVGITECTTCSFALACGGGCAAVAKNKTGNLLSPDCRPVQQLLSLGISQYYEGAE